MAKHFLLRLLYILMIIGGMMIMFAAKTLQYEILLRIGQAILCAGITLLLIEKK